jgi:hypothetical protein
MCCGGTTVTLQVSEMPQQQASGPLRILALFAVLCHVGGVRQQH